MALESRLVLAASGFAAAAIPFALLGYAATHGWPPLRDLDQSVANSFNLWAEDTPAAVIVLGGVSDVFHPWLLRAVTVGIVVALTVRKQRRLAAWLATTMVAAGLLGIALKSIVGRARPAFSDPVAFAGGSSFPSGHALNSFVFAAAMVLLLLPLVARRYRPLLWLAAGSLVLLVGFARVALGVHFVSDVIAGWIVGAGLVAVMVVVFETWRLDHGEPVAAVLTTGVDPGATRDAVGQDHGRAS